MRRCTKSEPEVPKKDEKISESSQIFGGGKEMVLVLSFLPYSGWDWDAPFGY